MLRPEQAAEESRQLVAQIGAQGLTVGLETQSHFICRRRVSRSRSISRRTASWRQADPRDRVRARSGDAVRARGGRR